MYQNEKYNEGFAAETRKSPHPSTQKNGASGETQSAGLMTAPFCSLSIGAHMEGGRSHQFHSHHF